MLFRRKHEFKPDKPMSGRLLSRLYITKKQWLRILKWLLMGLVLIFLSVVQDVIMSRVSIYGTTTELVAAAILLICILLDPEIGCVFTLVSALCYAFSGSAPGEYVIALLTVLGLIFSILRHAYLRAGFWASVLCTAGAMVLYELAVFGVACFLGLTGISHLPQALVKALLSLAVVPVVYPVVFAISKIGGEAWIE